MVWCRGTRKPNETEIAETTDACAFENNSTCRTEAVCKGRKRGEQRWGEGHEYRYKDTSEDDEMMRMITGISKS